MRGIADIFDDNYTFFNHEVSGVLKDANGANDPLGAIERNMAPIN